MRSAPASRLSLVAPPSRTRSRTLASELAGQARAPRDLEAHPRPGRDLEHEVHEAPRRGRRSRAARPRPASGPPPARRRRMRLARGLRLAPGGRPRRARGARARRGAARRPRSAPSTPTRADADARARADAEDGVGAAAAPAPASRLDEGLEVARRARARPMSRAARSRRGGPERLPGAQARGAAARCPPRHAVALDAHRREERRGSGAEDDLDALPRPPRGELDRDVLEAPGREHQLDRAAHGLAVEGLGRARGPRSGCEALAAARPPPGPRGRAPPPARTRRRAPPGGAEGEGEERACEHQRDWRIRTSNAQPRSTPVLAVPGPSG